MLVIPSLLMRGRFREQYPDSFSTRRRRSHRRAASGIHDLRQSERCTDLYDRSAYGSRGQGTADRFGRRRAGTPWNRGECHGRGNAYRADN